MTHVRDELLLKINNHENEGGDLAAAIISDPKMSEWNYILINATSDP